MTKNKRRNLRQIGVLVLVSLLCLTMILSTISMF